MFFALVHDNFVIVGPRLWNKLLFEEALQEECDVTYTLPTRNDEGTPFIIAPNVMILPIVSLPQPVFNSKIQRLDGPYWVFTDTEAQMSFTVVDLPIEAVKNQLKVVIANNRYTKEVGGIKMTIQGIEVSIDTARGSREIFFDAYNSMGPTETINWKFPECWLTLTKDELGSIVAAGKLHIQTCFDWERDKDQEIDSAQTLQALDAIILNFE